MNTKIKQKKKSEKKTIKETEGQGCKHMGLYIIRKTKSAILCGKQIKTDDKTLVSH